MNIGKASAIFKDIHNEETEGLKELLNTYITE